jgi:hypothetical protein
MAILPDVLVTNEPARVECGAPDYLLTRKMFLLVTSKPKILVLTLQVKHLNKYGFRAKKGLFV